MQVKILASSSKGNAYLYSRKILIDCGVCFDVIKKYIKDIEIVLISHEHQDHINIVTLEMIHKKKPSIKFYANKNICDKFPDFPFVKIEDYDKIKLHDFDNNFFIDTVPLYHKSSTGEECPNFGFLIKLDNIFEELEIHFHATDTFKIDLDSIPKCDSATLEFGHNKKAIEQEWEDKEEAIPIWVERNFISHLDEKKAIKYVEKIVKKGGKVFPAHMGGSIKKEQLKSKMIDYNVVEWWLNYE